MMKLYLTNTLNNLDYISIIEESLFAPKETWIKATKWKNFNIKKRVKRDIALREYFWLEFNKEALRVLIIDIDHTKMDNQELYQKIMTDIKVQPSWILQTDKGNQVGFILKDFISYKNAKPIKIALEIKRLITKALNADEKGSHRLKGFWRNPLTHTHLFFDNKVKLKDFYHLYPKQPTKQQRFNADIKGRQIQSKIFDYTYGNRNNFLFYSAMIETKGKKWGEDEQKVYNYLIHLMNEKAKANNVELLNLFELKATAKKVSEYNREGKNYVKVNIENRQSKPIKRGAMGFNPIVKDGYVNKITHGIETTYRQRKSAERTNKILREKEAKGEVEMTRAERAISNAKARAEKARKTVLNTITGLFADEYKKKSGSWHIGKISKVTGVSRNVVAKYIKEYEAELQKREEI